MELQKLVSGFIRRLWLIVLLMVVGGGIAFYLSYVDTIQLYSSKTTMFMFNQDKKLLGEVPTQSDLNVSRQLLSDYSKLVYSRKVYTYVKDEMGLNISQSSFRDAISVELSKDSSLIELSTVWTDPNTSAALANTTSLGLKKAIKEITNTDNLEIIDEAVPSKNPIQESRSKNLLIGLLAGIALASALIYILELFDNTIGSVKDIENELELSVIGVIPEHDIR